MLRVWDSTSRPVRLALSTAITLFLLYSCVSLTSTSDFRYRAAWNPNPLSSKNKLQLPAMYGTANDVLDGPGVCTERFGLGYLRGFSRSATNWCGDKSSSRLICFSYKVWDHSVKDVFCMGTNAAVAGGSGGVSMDCSLRQLTMREREAHVERIDTVPESWYGTGARNIYDNYMHLQTGGGDFALHNTDTDRCHVALLVKREQSNVIDNLWHVLMQLMSLWSSLDILRITPDPLTGQPMYTDEDIKNTQVIILDQDREGPLFEAWDMFGDLPTVRLNETEFLPSNKIVLPISGGTNPIWQSKDAMIPCDSSATLRAFVNRMLGFYGMSTQHTDHQGPLKIVWIDRAGTRKLVHQTALLTALRGLLARSYPDVELSIVDFAHLTFREQIMSTRTTDILVGVHGAGLTHTMWLPPGSTVVEIQPPGLEYYGFESIARMLGHKYSKTHGHEQEYEGMKHNWQYDDIFIEKKKFLDVIEQALKSTMEP